MSQEGNVDKSYYPSHFLMCFALKANGCSQTDKEIERGTGLRATGMAQLYLIIASKKDICIKSFFWHCTDPKLCVGMEGSMCSCFDVELTKYQTVWKMTHQHLCFCLYLFIS